MVKAICRIATLSLLAVAVLCGGWRLFRHNRGAKTQERELYFVDTLRYEDVAPESVKRDTLEELSLYTFRDTAQGRWSAEVSGSNVSLRSLVILDPQELRREFSHPEWNVALKSGIAPSSLWMGVGVSRSYGRFTLSLDGGYDTWQDTPYVGASVSYSIWQE